MIGTVCTEHNYSYNCSVHRKTGTPVKNCMIIQRNMTWLRDINLSKMDILAYKDLAWNMHLAMNGLKLIMELHGDTVLGKSTEKC